MSEKFMRNQPISRSNSSGCGLLGCAGGVLIGFLGGGLLLVVWSLVLAVTTAAPTPAPTADAPDLRLTLNETLLNHLAQVENPSSEIHLDILPSNRISLIVNTSISAFGVSAPVQIQGLFGLQIAGRSVEARLIDSKVAGFNLPSEMAHFFDQDVTQVNQKLAKMSTDLSTLMGAPLTLTGLGTTETELWLEIQETP